MKQKYHIFEMYYILTSSSILGMDPWVRCHGFIANLAGKQWSKYESFLISGCQGMDFQENFYAENQQFEDVLDFDL